MLNAMKNTNKTYKKKTSKITQIVYILNPSSYTVVTIENILVCDKPLKALHVKFFCLYKNSEVKFGRTKLFWELKVVITSSQVHLIRFLTAFCKQLRHLAKIIFNCCLLLHFQPNHSALYGKTGLVVKLWDMVLPLLPLLQITGSRCWNIPRTK